MNFRNAYAVYKKEMLEILRDKKTLILMILVPIILYPLIMVASMQMSIGMNTSSNERITIATNVGNTPILSELIQHNDPSFNIINVEDVELAIKDNTIEAYLEVNEFQEYTIVYDATKTNSRAKTALNTFLEEYKQQVVKDNLIAAGQDLTILEPISIVTKNIADGDSIGKMMLSMILPLLLITVISMGAMYPAIDITAGEKERGTLETMLTLPISNLECISGKYLAVTTIACITGFLNLISIGITGGFMISQLSVLNDSISLNFASLIPGLIITLLCILLFSLFISAVVMCVCLFANSFKEANNYITPLTLVVMLPCMLTMVPSITLSPQNVAIPVLNIALLIKDALLGNANIMLGTLVLVLNAIYGFLAIYFLSRIFKSESLLFKESSSSMFEFRENIEKREVPLIADALLVYLVGMFLLIYVGGYSQLKLGFNGLIVNQAIIGISCIGACFYLKTDWKKTFHITRPKWLNYVGGAVLAIGIFIVNIVISTVLVNNVNEVSETAKALEALFTNTTPFMGYVVICILPAIFEELFFRGFVFSALLKKVKPWIAILLCGILFGAFHMNLGQMVSASIMGTVFAYVTYKSKSIFPAMLMHFINNAVVQTINTYPTYFVEFEAFLNDISTTELLGCFLIGAGITGVGFCFIRWINAERPSLNFFKKQ